MFTFIVGCGRSGTTLLRAMLDSHGALAIPPESYFVVPALRAGGSTRTLTPAQVETLLETVLAFPSFAEWRLSPEEVREQVRAARPETAAELVRTLYRGYAEQQGKQHYGDKTPYHVRHLDLLAGAFPDARFVHLIRDGRDVAASLVKSHFGASRLPEGALQWRRHVEEGRTAGRRLSAERYHEVRYEDLVATPDETLASVTGFLGLEYDSSMLAYHERADALLGGMRRVDHLQGIHRPVKAVSDWRTHMTHGDVVLFDLLAGDLAADLGYERPAVSPRTDQRLMAAVWRAREAATARVKGLRARRAQRKRDARLRDR